MNYYKEIKNLIEEKEVNDKVRYLESNKETIKTYYEIGRLLIKAQGGEEKAKYGDGLIKKWSEKLTKEYENNYSYRNLNYMRKFYTYFKKVNTLCSQFNLSWSHYRYLLKFDNENERNYYINRCIQNNLSVRGLINEIKTKSFDRLSYDNKNYYVDLLLFNYKLNRFIVCELKLNSVNARDIGQTLNYIKIIDKTLKKRIIKIR